MSNSSALSENASNFGPVAARYGSIFEIGQFKGAFSERALLIQDAHTVRLCPAVFALHDVVAIPQDWSFLTADGRLAIDGTAINPFLIRKGRMPSIVPSGEDICTIAAEAAETIDEPVVFIGGDCLNNYYHWVVDFLPRLAMFQRHRERFAQWGARRIALIRDLPAYAREMLEPLGIRTEDIVWIDSRHSWRFRSLYVLSNFSQYGHVHPFCLQLLRKMLRPIDRGVGSRMLYVSRHDATSRRVRNEDELLAVLERRGFERIVPGSLSLAEQQHLFMDARVIVGAHGAGLTNMLFAGAGTAVVELRPNVNGLQHFRLLAEKLGQRYELVTASAQDMDIPNHHNSGFRIDPARVDAAVAKALSEIN